MTFKFLKAFHISRKYEDIRVKRGERKVFSNYGKDLVS